MSNIILSLGTYSGGLLGYQLAATTEKGKLQLDAKLIFAYSAHSSCVKASCSVGPLLLTGSTDETVRIFHIATKTESGSLSHHNASISAIDLLPESHPTSNGTLPGSNVYSASFALTGAEDGSLCIWRSKDWELVMQLKGHTSCIESISFHPSGRIALSVASGTEKTLRLWDLMRGTCAISQKFGNAPRWVEWNREGDIYGILFENHVLIRHASLAKAEISIYSEGTRKCTCMAFLPFNCLVIGDSEGNIIGYQLLVCTQDDLSVIQKKRIFKCRSTKQTTGVSQRVKQICVLPNLIETFSNDTDGACKSDLWFAAVSTSGILEFWYFDLKKSNDHELTEVTEPLLSINTNARVTTMNCNHPKRVMVVSALDHQTKLKPSIPATATCKKVIQKARPTPIKSCKVGKNDVIKKCIRNDTNNRPHSSNKRKQKI